MSPFYPDVFWAAGIHHHQASLVKVSSAVNVVSGAKRARLKRILSVRPHGLMGKTEGPNLRPLETFPAASAEAGSQDQGSREGCGTISALTR